MGEKTLQKGKIIGSDDDKHSQVNQSGSGRTKGWMEQMQGEGIM